jgi:serine protease Do
MSALRLVLLVALLVPGAAFAKKKKELPAPAFYELASPTLATVEYVQEYLAGGQKQQQRAYTDGVVISADGYVLISGKVRFPQRSGGRLAGGSRPELSKFRLFFADGRKLDATVVGFDDDLNLGVLKLTDPPADLKFVEFREGFEAEVGTPLRSMTLYSEEYGRTPVLEGMAVNALLESPQDVWSLAGASSNLLGAPLWDPRGKVVGVVAQVPMSPWAGRQVRPDLSGPVGLSYDRFASWLDETLATARKAEAVQDEEDNSGWFGVMFQHLDPDLAAHLKISEGGGIVLSRVIPGSPAEDAGMKALDVLVQLDGQRIAVDDEADTTTFMSTIRAYEPGQTATFVREAPGGERSELTVTFVAAPKSVLHAERRSNDEFELTVREITLDTLLGQRLSADTPGVVLDGVTRAGWAGLAGMQPGYIVQRINDYEVTDLDSFEGALAKVIEEQPEKVLFFVRFRRDTRFFVAEPDWTELDAQP